MISAKDVMIVEPSRWPKASVRSGPGAAEVSAPWTNSGETIRLVTETGSGIHIWNLDTSTWFDTACDAAGRNMTRAEWDQFGPRDTDYRATCAQYPIET